MKRIALLFLLVLTPSLFANTPDSKVTAVVAYPGPMPANAIHATAALTNGYDGPVTVSFAPYSAFRLDLKVTPHTVTLQPGETRKVQVTGDAAAVRKYAVFLEGNVRNADDLDLGPTYVPFHLEITASRGRGRGLTATLGDFQSLFIDVAERYRIPGVGWVYLASQGVPRGTARTPADPVEPQSDSTASDVTANVIVGQPPSTTIKGVFRWIDTSGAVRPAWGWRVTVHVEFAGVWVPTAHETFISTSGTWTIGADLAAGVRHRVIIAPANRYFLLENEAATKYQVGLGTFYPESVVDYGPHYWDLEQGAAAGLGELHLTAYDLYRKFVAANYSPVRPTPIKIIFPSSAGGSFSQNMTVLIPAEKARSSHSVRHELGHELMYEKWGQMPAGSGGFHNWPLCATKGLALAEGFAHFVSWWSTVSRDATSGTWGGSWNGEFLPDTVCQGIELNELRVAATFWDLHDSRVDGADIYSYNTSAHVLHMILGGGVKNSMSELLPRLESHGGPDAWMIEPILEMNYTNAKDKQAPPQ